jgi:hypothetical protein
MKNNRLTVISNHNHEPYRSKKELAAFLGRSTKWIENMHHHGLPSIQVGAGGRRMYRFSEVERWLNTFGEGGARHLAAV